MTSNSRLPECLNSFRLATLPAGTPVFRAGDPCTNFYFVQKGSVRVDLINGEGKSILLYRIGPGETCILSTSCLIAEEVYCAEAFTETEVEAIAVPKFDFQNLMSSSQPFRELVFSSFSSRLSMMMSKVDEVSFASLDKRLARRLLELGKGNDVIEVTHEQLANDLGSAREVISRKLLDWEKHGLIVRGRGSVSISMASGLIGLAGSGD